MAISPNAPLSAVPSGLSDPFARELLSALLRLRDGDFSARLPADALGVEGKVADAFNDIVATNARRSQETSRVCRMVGKEGKLRERLRPHAALGGWADEVAELNTLIDDLVWPTTEVTRTVGAVAKGDLAQAMALDVNGRPLEGEFLQSAQLVNRMIRQLSVFTSEVTRVAREVGTEGKLGGQAQVEGVSGVWKDLTDSVNQMAGNLTAQVRSIADVTIAVATGDLSKKVTVDVRGEILQLKEAINTMVDQLRSFASEVTRVAREVGTEGKLGGQAVVPGVAGTWKDLTDNVNAMASNLTGQVRNIAEVTTAVARGDLSREITVDARGEILALKNTINTMVDQLNAFASEVSRVAREVGTEGKLGGQAIVPGVAGTWKDLTDNVNSMASNLTNQVRNIADVTIAIASGDLSKKITVDARGEIQQLKEAMNTMVDQLRGFASEVTRVAREVGTEGKLGGQAVVPGVAGTWKDLTDSVNAMGSNLTGQVRNIAEVTTAVARGDLSRKITVDVQGEILELKDTINTMVDQLRAFASEVTRVAREVGTDGRLGGQADVPGVAGTWKDLTDSVNVMATNLTEQVRGIVKVVTAVADGNLRQKLTVAAKGEVAALAETINSMTDTLAIFADQVTNVAHEVGVEGQLGGQAHVPGAAGTWKDLTGNVNLLAANLTTQVRAIAEVATAVTKGDLTRSIQVDARGEVAELKDNINTMIDNLRGTTDRNREQDWLKTNLARFTSMLQGQRDLITVGRMLLSELTPLVGAQQGAVYQMERVSPSEYEETESPKTLRRLAAYAQDPRQPERVPLGLGLVGQAAAEKRRILLEDVPAHYTHIASSLGSAAPRAIVVLPVLFEGESMAVIELASLHPFTDTHLAFLDQLTQSIGVVLNTIEATMRKEVLLQQSQQLTTELQTRQIELQRTNEELASKALQLAEQNAEVERKNMEVEQARHALEEKAAELALTSKYKSEFLANMSHELRTPLNSILLLGQQLAANAGGNLTPKQTEFARNIHSAGTDLLTLIHDILDLSKIESGTVTVEPEEITFASLGENVRRTFQHVSEAKGLAFRVDIDEDLPSSFVCDPKRLQQILKNLLSNAFKFTAHGSVSLDIRRSTSGWSSDHSSLSAEDGVIAFTVTDTGIGIAAEKQKLIFEAFQQADAGTSRKYGGTGLGLAISRELATLLSGEIRLASAPREGSTFTLYLPLTHSSPGSDRALRKPGGAHLRASLPVLGITRAEETVADDRQELHDGDASLLIIEDDPHYARVLLGIARTKGWKGLVASRGQQGLDLARQYRPTAITLDVFLPDMLGWTVLNNLKLDPGTRHIPVQVISVEEERQHGLSHGAFAYLVKPATTVDLELALEQLRAYLVPHTKRLLIVEDDERERAGIMELLGHDDIELVGVESGAEALAQLGSSNFDCCVMDLRLPDMTGFELLARLQDEPRLRGLPIVVFTGKELSADEEARLRAVAKSIVLKDVQSPEQLLDETCLFLHQVIADLPADKRSMIERLHGTSEVLRGRKVLVVDDDVRNIFALTTLLESQDIEVLSATNGRKAISIVEETPDLGAVLMDIMMPEMDGYETIREIRKEQKFSTLPILALTAKAMKGDREKCLEAGASDYIAKPVNTEQLLSLLRVWLYR
ncbi:MAG TPA: response regulator [Polyangiaceae bacterium]|nr:response regulator [Polyangiaceae bacterium]